jgi:hypothetical protein
LAEVPVLIMRTDKKDLDVVSCLIMI